MEEKLKILYLARWYPNRYDPMPGLFIQRHAEAAANYCSVGVVYTQVVDDEKLKRFDVDLEMINEIPTAKVYYNNPKINIPIVTSLLKVYRFYRANAIGMKKIKEELDGFDLIHVHILTRLGIIALWHKLLHGTPYVISEHWSRYLSLTGDFKGSLRKWLTRLVVKNASAVTTVTQNLAVAMQSHGLKNPNYQVLANVVTDNFMNFSLPRKKSSGQTTFIHVSCFEDKSKNITGLLNVIKSLTSKRNDFVFKLVGEGMDFNLLKQYATDLGLGKKVLQFTGLLEGNALVKEIAFSDLMVVFSNYENFPVVINESFVLGVPVVATKVGGIPEFVNDQYGRLVNAGDEKALENLLIAFLDKKLSFNNQEIRSESRDTFSTDTIGKKLHTIYQEALP